jgi:polar amino acid transport system substrate-binding protein
MTYRKHLTQLAALGFLCGPTPAAAIDDDVITVAWRERPPYQFLDNGVPSGALIERTRRIFAAAGLSARLVNEPQKRIWSNFEHGAKQYCSMSWYWLPERASIARFSQPMYIDPPQIVLVARPALARVRVHPTLASLMTDATLSVGLVDGVSYGGELDAMISRARSQIMLRTVDTTSMMRMLAAGRASFMFVDKEDWEYFRNHDPTQTAIVAHQFPDMPPGQKRYIVCSRDVPVQVMDKLNKAITATGGPATDRSILPMPQMARSKAGH